MLCYSIITNHLTPYLLLQLVSIQIFTRENNKPTHDVNDAKERCSLDAVSIFEVPVPLLVGDNVNNLCVWDVLLLHFEVFVLNNLVCAVGFTQLDCSRRSE